MLNALCVQLVRDEAGFVVSAELVLIATVCVLALVVGLSEVATAINHELNDVASAFGSLNQSYSVAGFKGCKAYFSGSCFKDHVDDCDLTGIACDGQIVGESPKGSGGHGGYGK